jgi:hypothetical protein
VAAAALPDQYALTRPMLIYLLAVRLGKFPSEIEALPAEEQEAMLAADSLLRAMEGEKYTGLVRVIGATAGMRL